MGWDTLTKNNFRSNTASPSELHGGKDNGNIVTPFLHIQKARKRSEGIKTKVTKSEMQRTPGLKVKKNHHDGFNPTIKLFPSS